jgi:hypothetical protein
MAFKMKYNKDGGVPFPFKEKDKEKKESFLDKAKYTLGRIKEEIKANLSKNETSLAEKDLSK